VESWASIPEGGGKRQKVAKKKEEMPPPEGVSGSNCNLESGEKKKSVRRRKNSS